MTYPSPLLGRAGAVTFDGPDAGVAAHYGDPFREQRALTGACGIVDRSHRGVLRVPGADRLSWLHSITTQHVSELPDATGAESLVLSPHGHVEHHLQLAELDEVAWADVEGADAEPLLKFLVSMRFLLRVDPTDVTADYAVLSLAGATAPAVVASTGVVVGTEPWAVSPTPWGGYARRMPWPVEGAVDLVLERSSLVEAWDALTAAGAVPAGMWAWEALRVAVRRPRLGFETDHRTIPHEVGWLETAVHLQKGCYRGQETVARVHNLGRPPRRLVLLHLDGSDSTLPEHGADVTWSGARVGFVTSAARHHQLGPLALALVKRNTPDDAELLAGGIPAAVDDAAAAG
jgi:hypothetical protein